MVEHLPSAPVVMPGLGIESHTGLPAWSLLIPLPASASLCVSLTNKQVKLNNKQRFLKFSLLLPLLRVTVTCLCSFSKINTSLKKILKKILSHFSLRFYSFIHKRYTQRERQRHRHHARSPMWDLIPGLQDHALG